ncbi:MAG: uroporphyrinogen decarboxylase [Puniceicoccales bacterium]|jgi:uroporphyrinogen decarboxylase|nr:uroporphyrinogen decarboxylase [Puniceicoccales bacterium]
MTSRDRFFAACRCDSLERPPVWLMRQAGRYLPEYRALKSRHDFLTLVRTPELAAEVTLQPLQRFALDAAIVFSDILVIPEAMGQGYHFKDGGGIRMDFTLDGAGQIEALAAGAVRERLDYVAQALRLVRRELGGETALLGFAGSPWTLATYMVGGGSVDAGARLKALAREAPGVFGTLMEKLAVALVDYLKMQVENGADAVQIFDSWGALCGDADYKQWSLDWIERVIAGLPPGVPVIVFAKGMAAHAAVLAATGAHVISVDWTCRLRDVRAAAGPGVALQGNLDPVLLNATPDAVCAGVEAVLRDADGMPGHIFNLGHGILPEAKVENVAALVATVRAWRKG